MEEEGFFYLCSENKGADQLCGYREADLRLCFRICKNPVFSRRAFSMENWAITTALRRLSSTLNDGVVVRRQVMLRGRTNSCRHSGEYGTRNRISSWPLVELP